MKIGVQGTKSFNDYSVFLRAMGTALSTIKSDDPEFIIYSAGPSNINSLAMEFSNVSERGFKARGIKIRLIKVPEGWMKENILSLEYFSFFSKPKENVSSLVDFADAKGVSVGVYRY